MPKPTRLGPTRPVISLTSTVSGGDDGPAGQVPTSNDDGSVSWGSNVSSIAAGGSNLLGPFVNFAAGSNVLLTIDAGPGGSTPSNTIRIHATGGGSGIDRPLMAYDPGISNHLVVVDGDGTAVMVEDT